MKGREKEFSKGEGRRDVQQTGHFRWEWKSGYREGERERMIIEEER